MLESVRFNISVIIKICIDKKEKKSIIEITFDKWGMYQ